MVSDRHVEGFRLGDWRVRAAQRRLEGRESTRELSPEQLELLLALVERHGEAVWTGAA